MRSFVGVTVALAMIGLWGATLVALLCHPFIAGVLVMTMLHTGLFITAHDAMHGTVSPHPRLNDAIGAVCVALYALFSYRKLTAKHTEHHTHPVSEGDPDFHAGGYWRWYLGFVREYVSWPQLVGMAVAFNVLSHGIGVPEQNLLLYWVLPALLSTLQLFTFGTYLPHRGDHRADDVHRARSSGYPAWLSLLTCYHFGYHAEHHARPDVSWWRLPQERRRAAEAARRHRSGSLDKPGSVPA